jgi:hypothetical protein
MCSALYLDVNCKNSPICFKILCLCYNREVATGTELLEKFLSVSFTFLNIQCHFFYHICFYRFI